MYHLNTLKLASLDSVGVERRNPTRKLGTVQVANPYHVFRGELALAAGNARRQEAFTAFAQCFPRAGVDEQCSFGMVKKCNPTFAPAQARGLWHKQSPF